MATYEIEDGGKTYSVEGVDSPQAAYEQLQGMKAAGGSPAPAEPSMVVKAGRALNDIPRGLGLFARYALEGPASAAQIVTEPARYLTDRMTGMTGRTRPLGVEASMLADRLGLPTPETPIERVVGTGTKLGLGTMAGGGASRALSLLPGLPGAGAAAAPATEATLPNLVAAARTVPAGLAASPLQQVTGAVGAGTAGQTSKEAGGSELQQGIAALGGGIAGSFAPGLVQKAGESAMEAARRMFTPAMTPQQMDVRLASILQSQGQDFAKLPMAAKSALRRDMAEALRVGDSLDEAAIGRLAALRSSGVTPTRGMVGLDPVQITREKNLAKTGANSADTALQGMARVENANNQAIIGRLNDVGGGTNLPPIKAGELLQSRIRDQHAALGAAEQAAWDAAKAMPGYKTGQMSTAPVHEAFAAVDDLGLLDALAPAVQKRMQAFMTGQVPYTPQEYRNLRSLISGSLAPTASANEKQAARAAANALDAAAAKMATTNPGGIDFGNLPSTAATAARMQAADAAPQATIDAIDAARRATAAKYGYAESSPLVRRALAADTDPEQIAQQFVVGGTLNKARQVAQEAGPEGIATIRNALASHIKAKALSGAADETGKVSASSLKSALDTIGDAKLGLFFSPEELATLRNASRAASVMLAQPSGSAVNNSNSGALLLGKAIDVLDGMGTLPFGVGPALGSIGGSIGARQAQSVAPSLVRRAVPTAPPGAGFLLPGLALGGGLAAPQK